MRLKPLMSLVVFLTAALAAPVFAGTCAGLATALKTATGIRAEVVAGAAGAATLTTIFPNSAGWP